MSLHEKMRAWSADYGIGFSRQEAELGTRLSAWWPLGRWEYGVMQYVAEIPVGLQEAIETDVYAKMVHDLKEKIGNG